MAFQDILKKILDEAQMQVQAIEAERDAQKKELQVQSDQQLKEDLELLKKKSEAAAAHVDQKITSMARREGGKHALEVKNEIIQTALDRFQERLEKADDALYSSVLEKLFASIKQDSGRIFVSKKRLSITQKHAPKGCSFFEDESIVGGFVFRGVDSEIDNSFQNLVQSEFRQELVAYMAEHLKLV